MLKNDMIQILFFKIEILKYVPSIECSKSF